MSGAYNSTRSYFNDFSFICTTGTLIVTAEYMALTQSSILIKICSSCCSISGCFYLCCITYYTYKTCSEEPITLDLNTELLINNHRYIQTQQPRSITPLSDALRSSASAARAAPNSENMVRDNTSRLRANEA